MSPILVASILGVVVSVFAMEHWLNSFAYRIDLEWWFFASSVLLMIFIALITCVKQIFETLDANPIDALKEE